MFTIAAEFNNANAIKLIAESGSLLDPVSEEENEEDMFGAPYLNKPQTPLQLGIDFSYFKR